jgi:predicted nuclease of predicted toxin-antitoxin system
MNFLADESVDGQIVERLRQEGHDVLYVAEMEPGITDDQVLEKANENQALLMTIDKDFGELVFRLGRLHHGVVLVRLGGLSSERKAEIVAIAVSRYAESLDNSFSVISPGRIRIRPRTK